MNKGQRMNQLWLLVTASEVGIIVESSLENAGMQIKKARETLARLRAQQRTKSQITAIPKTGARSLSERILVLGTDFFSQPRQALEVSQELARTGFHYKPGRVRDELLRMVKRGHLRRIGQGKKSDPYQYVNP